MLVLTNVYCPDDNQNPSIGCNNEFVPELKLAASHKFSIRPNSSIE